MELLRGLDLDEFVDRFGPMPPEWVVYLLRQWSGGHLWDRRSRLLVLSGKRVFEAANAMQLIMAHVNRAPVRPSRSEIAIPGCCEELIMACLEKRREDRRETADELANLLDPLEVGEPWTREQAAKWWREHLPELA